MNTFKGLPIRGIHIDCKAQMMKFSFLCEIVKDAARWGYNTILLEYQDKFPFEDELEILKAPDALTEEQIIEFVNLCKSLKLNIIPLLQCLGHEYYVLRNKEFDFLGEKNDNGESKHSFCPSNPDSFEMFKKMAKQILKYHSDSEYFHIGGDEVSLSKDCESCKGKEKGLLLADYYCSVADWIRKRGATPLIWSDILLSYPNTLDYLRGKAVIMDWDYWSTSETSNWGAVRGEDAFNPESWSDIHKKTIRQYIYMVEPYLFNPFPYLKFLRDQGFLVIAAPAARSMGDPCFVPREVHFDNCLQAVYSGAQVNSLGVIVTSWAVRRCPWPTTELSLIAAAMAFKNPGVSKEDIYLEFSKEHFGVSDLELASVPNRLARAAEKAAKAADIITSGLIYPEMDMGYPEYYEARLKIKNQSLIDNEEMKIAYTELKNEAIEVKKILKKAKPKTEREKLRTDLWCWVADTAEFFGYYAPHLSNKIISKEKISELEEKLYDLRRKNYEILSKIYTDYALDSDDNTRIGIHLAYLESLREAYQNVK